MYRLAKKLYVKFEWIFSLCFAALSKVLLKSKSHEIFLSYNSSQVHDGFGAQVHRIFSLANTAAKFDFKLEKPEISQKIGRAHV